MSLWYETGNGMVTTKMARCNMNLDVYLCCPGPSLSDLQDNLHVPGVMVAALTTAYPTVRPDIWFGLDEPECYDKTIWWQPFIKICRGGYQNRECEGHKVKNLFNVFFADIEAPRYESDIFDLRQHDVKFVWHGNSMAFALHFLVWMGAKKIHLLGCDLGGNKDYCHDLILSPEHRDRNRRLYDQIKQYLAFFYEEGAKRDIHLLSCTEQSPINDFLPYTPIAKALSSSQSHIPDAGEMKYVLDANPSFIVAPN